METMVLYYLVKLALSASLIAGISEIAKRSSLFGALIASLPLTSLLAMIWMYIEKTEIQAIADLSRSIFWLVLPSLALFLLLPVLLSKGLHFWPSLLISVGATIVLYIVLLWVLHLLHVTL